MNVTVNPDSRGALLIADDEEIVRNGLAELLRRDGFACVVVDSGGAAVEQIRATDFDAMISDIHMPGNAQLELVRKAREIRAGLPVVLLTGRPTVETAARSVRLPVTAYLTKPPKMDELVTILDAAVADYRGLRALQAGRARLHEWDAEIERIERALRASPNEPLTGPMGSYLRLTLQQVILMLADLERAAESLERGSDGVRIEHEAALRRTVEVLERTRQNFKSKDLADLRKHIEQVLGRE